MAHYFDRRPHSPSQPRHLELVLPDRTLDLVSDAGVFAADRIDPGTKLLLLDMPAPPPVGHLLDLGCGYGPIAVTLALRSPGATVWAVDVNERARQLTAQNAAAAGCTNVRVAEPHDVPADISFAALASNPPIRIGKTALHELLSTWLVRLDPDASGSLVVQRHLGADSLAGWLAGEGWQVTRLRSRAGYRLLEVRR
jgi:16S rRNA (guanine1207-N2)-methyltransferase